MLEWAIPEKDSNCAYTNIFAHKIYGAAPFCVHPHKFFSSMESFSQKLMFCDRFGSLFFDRSKKTVLVEFRFWFVRSGCRGGTTTTFILCFFALICVFFVHKYLCFFYLISFQESPKWNDWWQRIEKQKQTQKGDGKLIFLFALALVLKRVMGNIIFHSCKGVFKNSIFAVMPNSRFEAHFEIFDTWNILGIE